MSKADDILRAIERLYASVMAPELWPSALDDVAALLRAGHVVLLAQDNGQEGPPLLVKARVDERDLARALHAEQHLRSSPVEGLPHGTAIARTAIVPDREYRRSEHYNEVVRPLRGFYGLAAQATGPAGGFAIFSCRSEGAGDYDGAETLMLQGILPHLATALALRRHFCLAEQRLTGFAAMLDRLDSGAILTDAAGRPSFVNASASAMIAEADGLGIDQVGLTGATPAITRQLRSTIASVAESADPTDWRLRLPRPSRRLPLLVTVLPAWRLGVTTPGAPAPRAAIFIREPDAPAAIDAQGVADAFGLTARECEVAVLLAAGTELPDIATQLAISLATVRQHLKHLFEKTGAHTQAGLVALVRGFVIPSR
jgi:DNA-binding CsgD family transcriptional regulator